VNLKMLQSLMAAASQMRYLEQARNLKKIEVVVGDRDDQIRHRDWLVIGQRV